MPRLLVVEDHPDNLDMLTMLLTSAGYQVVPVSSREEAVRALEKSTFDLVVTDLMLGQKNLNDAWDTIGALQDLAHPAPLGLVTAWLIKQDDARRASVSFVLLKPCSRDQLFDQLATTLRLPGLDEAQQAKLRAYFDCIERGTYEELRSLCVDDVTYRLPGTDTRFSKQIHGRDEFVAFTAQTFDAFREPRFEITSMRPLPAGALVEYVGSWREGDKTRRMPGAVMFEFRGPLISAVQVRVDTDELT